jgi:hypothetical protein
MLVKVLSFGSNWWARCGRNKENEHLFTRHAVCYNSTGVRCGRKIRRHWIIAGLVRLNGIHNFDPYLSGGRIGETFVCSDLTQAFGGNRLLCHTKAPENSVPDCYLVVVSSSMHGRVDFTSNVWKSVLSSVIAATQLRETQEVMLLMKPGDWVQTGSGFWQLNVPSTTHEPTGLVRVGERISA